MKDDTVVTTVMSNIVLYKALDKANIKYEISDVGDKNIHELMLKNDYKVDILLYQEIPQLVMEYLLH